MPGHLGEDWSDAPSPGVAWPALALAAPPARRPARPALRSGMSSLPGIAVIPRPPVRRGLPWPVPGRADPVGLCGPSNLSRSWVHSRGVLGQTECTEEYVDVQARERTSGRVHPKGTTPPVNKHQATPP